MGAGLATTASLVGFAPPRNVVCSDSIREDLGANDVYATKRQERFDASRSRIPPRNDKEGVVQTG